MKTQLLGKSDSSQKNLSSKILLGALSLIAAIVFLIQAAPTPAFATSGLTIDVITWDVIGLDSNDEATGPDTFPIGVHICNTTGSSVSDVSAELAWDSVNSYITNDGASTYAIGTLAASACADAYFSIKVARDDSARGTTRDYHVTATGTGGYTISTQNRRLKVEQLVSQNRNVIDRIAGAGGCNADFTSCAAAPTAVTVGSTYTYKLYGNTSTSYEQLEATISFPGTIFKVISVTAAYEDPSTYSGVSPYADACGWIDDRTDADWNECGPTIPADFTGSAGKAGGDVVVTYVVEVVGTGSGNLDGLFYDFSGSSYHYNSDFGGIPLRVGITATDPGSSPSPSASVDPSASPSPEASGDGGGVPSTNTESGGEFRALTLTILAIWLAGFAILARKRSADRVDARSKR